MNYRQTQEKTAFNFLLNDGGLGDQIARLPAVKYAIENHPHMNYFIYVPDYFKEFTIVSLQQNLRPGPKANWNVRSFSEAKAGKYNEKLLARAFSANPNSNMACHMTRHAFEVLCCYGPEDSEMNYLKVDASKLCDISKLNIPEKFIVISTGFTAPVREMLPEYVNDVAKFCISKGYSVVFLGKEETQTGVEHVIKGTFNDKIDFSLGLNLINKTNLLETQHIISKSTCLIGLDNGLTHLAGTTDTAVVCGYTSVLPHHREPYRHDAKGWNWFSVTVPKQELSCANCQSNWQFTWEHDFKFCYYKDYKCVKLLNSTKYIDILAKIL